MFTPDEQTLTEDVPTAQSTLVELEYVIEVLEDLRSNLANDATRVSDARWWDALDTVANAATSVRSNALEADERSEV